MFSAHVRLRAAHANWLSLALILANCAGTAPFNPYKVPPAEIKARVKTVALSPVDTLPDLDNPDRVKAGFEALIAAKLREAGFMVVPSAEYAAIWKQTMKKAGGVFDPATGKRNEHAFAAARETTVRELFAKTGANALLDAGIGAVNADIEGNYASWHGAGEYVTADGALGSLFGPQYRGTINALSLIVILSDADGRELYANAGGIQTLSRLQRDGRFVSLARHELFINDERNRHAVDVALGPLTATSPGNIVSSPPQNSR